MTDLHNLAAIRENCVKNLVFVIVVKGKERLLLIVSCQPGNITLHFVRGMTFIRSLNFS